MLPAQVLSIHFHVFATYFSFIDNYFISRHTLLFAIIAFLATLLGAIRREADVSSRSLEFHYDTHFYSLYFSHY